MLTEDKMLLLTLYAHLSKTFDECTQTIIASGGAPNDQAQMQAKLFAAVLNDFISSLPGVKPDYIKKIVDYVFELRAEVLGPEPVMPQMTTHRAPDGLN
jgi:hypothetical protein